MLAVGPPSGSRRAHVLRWLFAAVLHPCGANDATWPGPDASLSTARDAAFTLLLIASISRCRPRSARLEAGRSARDCGGAGSLVLGAAFLANQGFEWATLPLHPDTSSYARCFS